MLEKAYAKLHGSYDNIAGGRIDDALVDLTGGVARCIQLHLPESRARILDGSLWTELLSAAAAGASIQLSPPTTEERS